MSEDDLQKRVRELETEQALLLQRQDQLESDQDDIKGVLSKIGWIVGGGFIASIVAWIVGGGLAK